MPTDATVEVVIGRLAEMRIVDPNTRMMLTNANIPYGSKLFFDNGDHQEGRRDLRMGPLQRRYRQRSRR